MFSKTNNKTIQPIKPPSAERRNGYQAQYFPQCRQAVHKNRACSHALSFEFQMAFRLSKFIRNNKCALFLTRFSRKTEVRISNPYLPCSTLKLVFALFIAGCQTHIDKFHHQIFFRPEKGFHFFQRIDFPNHRRQSCMNDGRDFAIGCFIIHGGFEV